MGTASTPVYRFVFAASGEVSPPRDRTKIESGHTNNSRPLRLRGRIYTEGPMNSRTEFSATWYAVMKVILLATLLLTLLPPANADSVTINSGSSGTFLDSGFQGKDFTTPFSAANFMSPQTGPHASILVPPNSAYVSSLPDGPG